MMNVCQFSVNKKQKLEKMPKNRGGVSSVNPKRNISTDLTLEVINIKK